MADDLSTVLASTETLTRSQIADLVADVLPPSFPLLQRVALSGLINLLPDDQLPVISRVFREGMTIAQEQGVDAFCEYLRGLDVPDELIEVVKQYAPQQ